MLVVSSALSFLGNMNIAFLGNEKFRGAICSEMERLCPFIQRNPNPEQGGKVKTRSTGIRCRKKWELLWWKIWVGMWKWCQMDKDFSLKTSLLQGGGGMALLWCWRCRNLEKKSAFLPKKILIRRGRAQEGTEREIKHGGSEAGNSLLLHLLGAGLALCTCDFSTKSLGFSELAQPRFHENFLDVPWFFRSLECLCCSGCVWSHVWLSAPLPSHPSSRKIPPSIPDPLFWRQQRELGKFLCTGQEQNTGKADASG